MTTQSVTVKTPAHSKFRFSKYILEGILVLLFVVLSFTAPGFLSWPNFFNILRNASTNGIIAFGMTFVMISGEIDLSVGNATAFFGCLSAVLVRDLVAAHYPVVGVVIFAIAVCLVIGILAGFFMGWIRTRFSVPTFISALALMFVYRGGAHLLTNSFPVLSFPDWFYYLGSGYLFGVIPFQAIIFLLIFAIMWFVSKYTTFGRAVYAVGGNPESARLSGINVTKMRMGIMALTGFFAAVSGLIIAAQIQCGNPTIGSGEEFNVIAACVIGGVSMMGGKGRMWSTFIGVMFLRVILNGMTLMNINEYWQYVARAVLILGAVLIYQAQEARKA
jgi:simple sugar transport system permease protein/ribose transport system permease protein